MTVFVMISFRQKMECFQTSASITICFAYFHSELSLTIGMHDHMTLMVSLVRRDKVFFFRIYIILSLFFFLTIDVTAC